MTESEWLRTLLGPGGLLVALMILVVTGVKGMWVFAWVHDRIVEQKDSRIVELTAEKDEWKDLALSQAGIIEETVERTSRLVYKVAETAATKPREGGHG